MFWLIIYTLTFTFALAGFLTWRENRLNQSINQDIRKEWYKKNRIDKK